MKEKWAPSEWCYTSLTPFWGDPVISAPQLNKVTLIDRGSYISVSPALKGFYIASSSHVNLLLIIIEAQYFGLLWKVFTGRECVCLLQ